MISVEDWAEIRRQHQAEKMPIQAVARQLGISKNTVKRALATDRPPVYRRPAKGLVVDSVEPQIRELLKQTPKMPATMISERIGRDRGITILKERMRELRPAYLQRVQTACPSGPAAGLPQRLDRSGTGLFEQLSRSMREGARNGGIGKSRTGQA